MAIPLFQVDAFADRPFAGNPAAICLLESAAEAGWMQDVAREMNLSETAFVHREQEGWRLRWFTPKVEVALCGHATLASAHILWQTGRLPLEVPARFHTQSGLLTAVRRDAEIELDFPAKPAQAADPPAGLAEALGARLGYVGRSQFDYLVEVATPAELRQLQPDFVALGRLPVRGVIVTSVADLEGFDFICRFFAPAAGVNEDPVTGSAHCTLGPFWAGRLGRSELTSWQASRRGGRVGVRVGPDRVKLRGAAVTVWRGQLE